MRQLVPPGSATAKASDYSFQCWCDLTRVVADADVPISNHGVASQIRPIEIGRSNGLFAGSLRAAERLVSGRRSESAFGKQ